MEYWSVMEIVGPASHVAKVDRALRSTMLKAQAASRLKFDRDVIIGNNALGDSRSTLRR